ncbi:MAG TPA: PLP-dependent aminotransferase family protein [Pyrinomonadaceae bacterium]
MTIWSPDLSNRSGPLVQAIVGALADDIEAGHLLPGARLPTHRELADKLSVAIGTVTRAYLLAQRRGLISGEIGRGTFVRSSTVYVNTTGIESEESSVIDLSKNRVIRDARDPLIAEALSSLSKSSGIDHLVDYYQPAEGAMRHRATGARWLSRANFTVQPEQILLCSGAQHAMFVALSTLTEPGDTVLTENVSYPGIKALANLLHLQLQGLPVDEHGLQPEAFAAACRARAGKVLYCIPTIQNPTATVMPEDRRREIARLAQEHGVAIVEDDVYGFLDRDAPPPIAAFAPEQCYYINGTSKSIAPGLRIGYMVAPVQSVNRTAAAISSSTWEAAPLMAEMVTRWIEDGTLERVINWKRRETQTRQALARKILGNINEGSHPMSCHLWLELPDPWRGVDFSDRAAARGVLVAPAEAFVTGRGAAPHAVRICLLSTQDRFQLEKGLDILQEILHSAPEPALTIV